MRAMRCHEVGRITLQTANVDIDETLAAAHPGATAGPHVRLTVSDTGVGMTAGGTGADLRTVLHDQGRRARARDWAWPPCTAS